MKKKIILSIIVILLAGFYLFFLILDKKKNPELICEYPSNSNYAEQLVFKFKGKTLEKFYRKEKFEDLDSDAVETVNDYFEETKENIKNDLNNYVKYNIEKGENSINITTYIYVPRSTDFFDYYFTSKEIYHFMDIDTIKSSLEEENYSCKVKK